MRKWKKVVAVSLAAIFAGSAMPINALAYTNSEGKEGALKDGVYQGSAQGRNGDITMEVTIADGKISSITALEQKETPRFWEKAITVVDSIISSQSTEVDSISGATISSDAIKQATAKALESAFTEDSAKESEEEQDGDSENPKEEQDGDSDNPEEEKKDKENPEDENKDKEDEEITALSGEGTKENPYVISDEKELAFFRNSVNDGETYQGKYIKLTSDISLTEAWTPIGAGKSTPFSGKFDGDNYTISNMTIDNDSVAVDGSMYYAGLFGYATSYSDFTNVNLTNTKININDKAGIVYAGALVGCLSNTVTSGDEVTEINHCSAKGQISVGTSNKSTMTGGLVGMSNQYAAIANNTVKMNVAVDTEASIGFAGGLVGMASVNGLIMNNAVICDVSIDSSNANANAGGIVAQASTCLIYNNYSKGSISGTRCGGVAANILSNTEVISNYYSAADAFGNNSGHVDSDSVLQMTTDKMSDSAFATLMHDNLSADAITKAVDKVTSEKISFNDFSGRIESYNDWMVKEGDVVLSNSAFKESTPSVDASIFEAGSGTKEDPYIISDETQLRAFATSLSEDNTYNGKFIALSNDIELKNGEWTPIGEGEYAFNGDFDGRGHKVSNIYIGTEDNHHVDEGTLYYGFFGVIEKEAYVHDLSVDVSLYAEGNGSIVIGGLVAYSEGTIDSCTVDGTVWGRSGIKKTASNHYGGGLAGYISRAAVLNCVSRANVYSQATAGVAEAGGIVGLNNRSLIANCVGNGEISGCADRVAEGMAALGGIAAVHAGTMTSCVGNAEITALDYSMYVGELAGWATGIGYLYNNYYNLNSKQIIEGKQVNPVESVGWLVGPGVSDENEAYSGGINYEAVGVKSADLNTAEFAEKLNGLFEQYPAQVSDFTSKASLKEWETGDTIVLPIGGNTAYSYKEIVVDNVEKEEKVITGKFYGRSDDKTTIVEIYYDENKELVVNVITGSEDVNSDSYKSALEAAKKKMELDDHTEYGKVDASIFDSGEGTVESPYMIANEKQLVAFNKSINADEDYKGLYVALKNDISLTSEWKLSGGSNPYAFSGNFDGKGHTISNINVGSADNPSSYRYAGLFPYLKGAIVKNLNLENVNIYTKTEDDRRFYAGALSAFADSTGLEGCIDSVNLSKAHVSVESYSGAAYAGGLIGSDQFDVIANCRVDASVEGHSKAHWNYTGILTGIAARSAIINNRVSGDIAVNGNLNKAAAGGLGGFVAALTYSNACDVNLSSVRYTNDLGQVAGRNTGIAYIVKDYYNSDASTVCGDEKVETRALGTVVSGTTEGKGVVGEMTGLSSNEFDSDKLLKTLNTAASTDEYKTVLTFLNTNWGIDFEALSEIRPWSLSEDKNTSDSNGTTGESEKSSTSNTGSSTGTSSTSSTSTTSGTGSVASASTSTTANVTTIADANVPAAAVADSESSVVNNKNTASSNKTVKKQATSTDEETEATEDEKEEVDDEKAAVSDKESISEDMVPKAADSEDSAVNASNNGVTSIVIIMIIAAFLIVGAVVAVKANKKRS